MEYKNFSSLFKLYIQNSQKSISSLSKSSGIDRTLIQKYISGNRLPTNYNSIENILQLLALTQVQKDELKRLYKLEKIGYKNFNKLLLLKSIVFELENNDKTAFSYRTLYSGTKKMNIAKNINELKYLTYYIINKIDPKKDKIQILLNTNNQLFSLICQFSKLFPQVKIDLFLHLETLSINNLSNNNLLQLKNVIKLLKINKNVIIHYTYIDNTTDYTLYPFLISTTQHLLLINSNVSSGILLKNNKCTQQEFDKKFFNAKKFIRLIHNNLEYKQSNLFFKTNNHPIMFYSGSPFIIPWIDSSTLEQHYIGSINKKEQIINSLITFQNNIKEHVKKHKIYFYCNLYDFNELFFDIYPNGLSKKIFKPFSRQELRHILDNMIQIIENEDNYILNIIDNTQYKFSSDLNIQVFHNNLTIISQKYSFNILETTIHHDFQLLSLFFNELEECVFDKKNSIIMFKKYIKEKIDKAVEKQYI